MSTSDPTNTERPGEHGGGREERLAARLVALEESHTFLARTLDALSDEINHVGTALVALAKRVDRLDDRILRPDPGPFDGSPDDGT